MLIRDFVTRVLVGLELSRLQMTAVVASQGQPLTAEERGLFVRHAAVEPPATAPFEFGLLKGRRGGGTTYVAAPIALYRAFDPRTAEGLGPGQHRDITCIAPTRKQAKVLYDRLTGLILAAPLLRREIDGMPTTDEITLRSGVRITVAVANSASVRGFESAVVVMDEAAFFGAEGRRSDEELCDALIPSLITVPGAQLVWVSSPWIASGRVYEQFQRRRELEDTVVLRATSQELNPKIPAKVLDRERRRDPQYFAREYEAEWVDGIGLFLPTDSINACVVRGRERVPPQKGLRYVAIVDQGYTRDSFVLAIGHRQADRVVVDRLRGWHPSKNNPVRLERLLPELSAELDAYHCSEVLGDQFGSNQFSELLRQRGIRYGLRAFTPDTKVRYYDVLRELIVGERIELPEDTRALRELRMLEVRATPEGRLKIEAPRGEGLHDDYPDALAVLAHELRARPGMAGAFIGQRGEYAKDPVLDVTY